MTNYSVFERIYRLESSQFGIPRLDAWWQCFQQSLSVSTSTITAHMKSKSFTEQQGFCSAVGSNPLCRIARECNCPPGSTRTAAPVLRGGILELSPLLLSSQQLYTNTLRAPAGWTTTSDFPTLHTDQTARETRQISTENGYGTPGNERWCWPKRRGWGKAALVPVTKDRKELLVQ